MGVKGTIFYQKGFFMNCYILFLSILFVFPVCAAGNNEVVPARRSDEMVADVKTEQHHKQNALPSYSKEEVQRMIHEIQQELKKYSNSDEPGFKEDVLRLTKALGEHVLIPILKAGKDVCGDIVEKLLHHAITLVIISAGVSYVTHSGPRMVLSVVRYLWSLGWEAVK